MRNAERTIVITALICGCFMSTCSDTLGVERRTPTVRELFDRYAKNQDKFQSFIVKGMSSADINGSYSSPQWKKYSGKRKKYVNYELRFDTNRFNWRCQMWGNLRFPGEFIPRSKAQYKNVLWDGEIYYQHAKADYIRPGPGEIKIDKVTDQTSVKKTIPSMGYICSPMFGYIDSERIDSILRQADTTSLRDKMEQIGASRCYVIDAVTMYGKYTVWIDEERGYSIARAEVLRAENDLVLGEVMRKGDSMALSLRNVRFEKISDMWIPMEADFEYSRNLPNGDFSRSKTHYKRTAFTLNPDNDVLGSFVPDGIANGTKVRIRQPGGGHGGRQPYTWRDGHVVDGRGRKVDLKESKSLSSEKLPSLLGKNWLELKEVKLVLETEQVTGKRILACFFDMQQRPSRNRLRQLGAREQELKAKDIVVVAVQASKVDKSTLKEWVKGNDISLLVGTIEGDEEKTRFNWGVKSLPWLILTNNKHSVVAEGFNLKELDNKLEQLGDK